MQLGISVGIVDHSSTVGRQFIPLIFEKTKSVLGTVYD